MKQVGEQMAVDRWLDEGSGKSSHWPGKHPRTFNAACITGEAAMISATDGRATDARRDFGLGLGAALLLSAALSVAGAFPATAQDLPRQIKIVFPFPAGSAGDTVSRIVGAALQTQTGRTVIVENRAGAGGITGTRSVVGAEADGSTLIVVPSAVMTMIPLYNADPGYNPEKDFKPLAHLVSQDLSLAVGPALPVKSLQELIETVRKEPGKGSYGTPGAGSSLHLIGVKLGELAKITLVPVHYRGAALALNDVVAGQLPMMLSPMPDQIEQHRAGRIRILATAGDKRSPFLDGVPTLKEAGFDINAQGWYGAFAPVAVPDKIAAELGKHFIAAVNAPENKARLAQIGFVSVGAPGATLGTMVNRDIAYWGPVFKSSGFKP
jgi:tripartite-type tricarboxylate transporter receptor subunit TctC